MLKRRFCFMTPLLALLLLASPAALADGYLGFGVGIAESSVDEMENAAAGRIHGGYLFSRNYAVEVGYIDFGDFDAENAPAGNSIATNGVYAALAGFNRITDRVELTGKLGALQFDHEVKTAGAKTFSGDGTSAFLGVGVNFYLSPSVALGTEFTHVNDVEDEHINSLWLQLHARLGARD